MTDMLAVELNGVQKNGQRKQLGPIHLHFPLGYIVALVGPNGSGKSSILNMMLQLLQPDAGEIRWFNSTYDGRPIPTEVRQRIAYVPEHPLIEENYMRVEEAIKFRSYWYPTWDKHYLEQLLTKFEIPRQIKLSKMSKGERRKFEIATALAARPQLLILDEPSSGLDPFAWKQMIEELRVYMQQDEVTIIISSHIVEEVKRLADYVVLIHQGQAHGMVEKDMLLGSWQEVWIRGDRQLVESISSLVSPLEEGPSVWRAMVSSLAMEEEVSFFSGAHIIKKRSLELDEILELWMRGNMPEEMKWNRGGE